MLDKARIEALCTDGMYAGVNGDQAEWKELCALALRGLARPEDGGITQALVEMARENAIEECAKAAEGYNWVDDYNVQSPDEHQAALAYAIRALKSREPQGQR